MTSSFLSLILEIPCNCSIVDLESLLTSIYNFFLPDNFPFEINSILSFKA